MPTPDEINAILWQNAQGPKKAEGDEGSFEQHSLDDLIKAAKHLGATETNKSPLRGIQMTRLVPPGASA